MLLPVYATYSRATKTIMIKTTKIKQIGIQSGENTHHQDQSKLPVSFNIKNIKKTIVVSPNPLSVFSIVNKFI